VQTHPWTASYRRNWPVEDVHYRIDGFVLAGDFLLMEVAFKYLPQPGQSLHVRNDSRPGIQMRGQSSGGAAA
jgi:hypothetical protein